jgi:hypothetical protein
MNAEISRWAIAPVPSRTERPTTVAIAKTANFSAAIAKTANFSAAIAKTAKIIGAVARRIRGGRDGN